MKEVHEMILYFYFHLFNRHLRGTFESPNFVRCWEDVLGHRSQE